MYACDCFAKQKLVLSLVRGEKVRVVADRYLYGGVKVVSVWYIAS